MQSKFAQIVALGVAALGVVSVSCTKSVDAAALSPQALQDRYGITNAYTGQVSTPEGAIHGTIVPVTLPDGRKGQLIVPDATQEYHPKRRQ